VLWPGSAEWSAPKGRWREWRDRCELVVEWEDRGRRLVAELSGGAVRWQVDGADSPPPGVPPHELSACWSIGVADLLAANDATADDLARRVRVAVSGGFDLEAISEDNEDSKLRSQAKRQATALREASLEVARCQREHDALAEREDDRAGLEVRRQEAHRAGAERDAATIALDLAERRVARESVAAELRELPADLGLLVGNEIERLDALRKIVVRKEEEQTRKRTEVAKAERLLQTASFASAPPNDAERNECRERLTACEKLSGRTREVERNVLAGRDQLARAADGFINVTPADTPLGLRDEDLAQADEWLGRWAQLAVQVSARQLFLESLARERVRVPVPSQDEKSLASRVHWLSAWLKEEEAPSGQTAVIARWALLVVALAGALAAFRWPGPGLAAAIAGIVALAWLLSRRRSKSEDRHATIERELRSLGLDPGSRWTGQRALVELAAAIDALAACRRDAVFLDEEQRGKAALTEDEQRLAQWNERRDELVLRLRLPDSIGDTALRDVVERVKEWRRARVALNAAEADLAAAHQQLDAELSRLCAILERFGPWRPSDVPQAKAAVQDLADRTQRHETARREIEQALDATTSLEGDVRGLHDEMGKLFADAGIEDKPGDEAVRDLRERLAQRPRFLKLSERARELDVEIRDMRRRLDTAEQLSLELKTRDQLETAKREAEDRAMQYEPLVQQLERLKFDVDAAKQGAQLETARAKGEAARDALHVARDEMLDAALRRHLLDRLRRRHEDLSQPPVLEHARTLFRRFTRGEWDLAVTGRGEDATFRAQRGGGMALDLDQLSDGTRAQLLIAARVAFAIEAEQSVDLPLFLDEALAVADAERFRGAVEALLELAREGRQIIYLAADRIDVEHWKVLAPPSDATLLHEIDLAQVRGIASAAPLAELRLPPRATLAPPGARNSEEYAALLRVPSFDALQPIEQAHLFHALRDQLPLLHRTLDVLGVETIGAWESLLAAVPPSANGEWAGFDAGERARIDARIACARAWHDTFRIGRGRRVDREALTGCESVSKTWLERLCKVAGEADGDARAIVARLENSAQDPDTKGFRADKKVELVTFFEANGYLDPRPRLPPEHIRAAVLEAARMWLACGVITQSEVLNLVHGLSHASESVRSTQAST
jgi:uncharacterized protein YhaN